MPLCSRTNPWRWDDLIGSLLCSNGTGCDQTSPAMFQSRGSLQNQYGCRRKCGASAAPPQDDGMANKDPKALSGHLNENLGKFTRTGASHSVDSLSAVLDTCELWRHGLSPERPASGKNGEGGTGRSTVGRLTPGRSRQEEKPKIPIEGGWRQLWYAMLCFVASEHWVREVSEELEQPSGFRGGGVWGFNPPKIPQVIPHRKCRS